MEDVLGERVSFVPTTVITLNVSFELNYPTDRNRAISAFRV
jgi:hypothetical protein